MYRWLILAGIVGAGVLGMLGTGCGGGAPERKTHNLNDEERYLLMREKMVKIQIERRGIADQRVLAALKKVPRHRFVPPDLKERAYDDGALPIGERQTISQPYIVAIMTELLRLKGDEKVLEIGTGSGYQAAVLAEVVRHVYTIEILESLAKTGERRLQEMGYTNVTVRCGDGYQGWPEVAPFDAVIVTAAPEHIPQPLIDQLRVGGRMVIPVGRFSQDLMLLVKEEEGVRKEQVIPVRFVPMTGEAQRR